MAISAFAAIRRVSIPFSLITVLNAARMLSQLSAVNSVVFGLFWPLGVVFRRRAPPVAVAGIISSSSLLLIKGAAVVTAGLVVR